MVKQECNGTIQKSYDIEPVIRWAITDFIGTKSSFQFRVLGGKVGSTPLSPSSPAAKHNRPKSKALVQMN